MAFYSANQALGLFVFLLVEEAGAPIWFLPGDALLIAAGATPGNTPATVALILLAATAGAFVGSTILYADVRRGGCPVLNRYGRFLHLNDARVATIEGWLRRFGPFAIVAGRLIPGLRTPTTVMSGLLDVPYYVFAPSTAVAALLWAMLYFFAGSFLVTQWQSVVALLTGSADEIVEAAGFVVLVAAFIGLLVKHHRDARALTSRDVAAETRTESDGNADVGAMYDELVAAVRI